MADVNKKALKWAGETGVVDYTSVPVVPECMRPACTDPPAFVIAFRLRSGSLAVSSACAKCMPLVEAALDKYIESAAPDTGEEAFLRALASEFFYEDTFDKLIAASPDPVTVTIADELKRRADAIRGAVMPGGVASR